MRGFASISVSFLKPRPIIIIIIMEKRYVTTKENYAKWRKENPVKKAKCFTSPSLTVPDLTMTIDELLARYQRGLPLPQQKIPYYEDDDTGFTTQGTSLQSMDLIDIHYLKKSYVERNKILRENYEKQLAENEKKMADLKLKRKDYDDWVANQMGKKETPAPILP